MSGGFSASYKQLAGSPVVVAAMLEETRSALKFTKMCKYWGSKRCLGWKFVFVDWCDFFFTDCAMVNHHLGILFSIFFQASNQQIPRLFDGK